MNFVKMIIGVCIIAGGGILEILWLSFLFGSVLGIILILIFAPHLLVLPWNICLVAGLAFMGSEGVDDCLSTTIAGLKKATKILLQIFGFSVKAAFVVGIIAVSIHLYMQSKEGVANNEKFDKEIVEKEIVEKDEYGQDSIMWILEDLIFHSNKKWVFQEETDSNNEKIGAETFAFSKDGNCKLSVSKKINENEIIHLNCRNIIVSDCKEISVQFDSDRFYEKLYFLKKHADSNGVYIPYHVPNRGKGYMMYEDFRKRLVTASSISIKLLPIKGTIFQTEFSLSGSENAINQLGKKM